MFEPVIRSGGIDMPYQNRVNPLGELVATSAKGTLMGNRGRLHDADQRIGRKRWTTKSWVTCALSFNGRKRQLLAPNNYTELFFLDEVTALTAGHRPCAECRRENHKRFIEAWRAGTGVPPDQKVRVGEIDPVLHADRIVPILSRPLTDVVALPDAVMVTVDGSRIWAKWNGSFREWSFEGYGPPEPAPSDQMIVVTPASTVRVLRAGYKVDAHSTAML